jgi:hypothetical protein
MTELFEHVAAKRVDRLASADDAFENLFEILEILQEVCDWSSSHNWSKDHMRSYFLSIKADLGYCLDRLLELQFLTAGASE